jgi:hypothetical protein
MYAELAGQVVHVLGESNLLCQKLPSMFLFNLNVYSINWPSVGDSAVFNLCSCFYVQDFFHMLLHKAEGKRAEWEYPFAAGGVNISYMLVQMLGLQSGDLLQSLLNILVPFSIHLDLFFLHGLWNWFINRQNINLHSIYEPKGGILNFILSFKRLWVNYLLFLKKKSMCIE